MYLNLRNFVQFLSGSILLESKIVQDRAYQKREVINKQPVAIDVVDVLFNSYL